MLLLLKNAFCSVKDVDIINWLDVISMAS